MSGYLKVIIQATTQSVLSYFDNTVEGQVQSSQTPQSSTLWQWGRAGLGLQPCSAYPTNSTYVDTHLGFMHYPQQTAIPWPPPGTGRPGRLHTAIRRTPPREADHTGPGNGLGAVQDENSRVLGTWARLWVDSLYHGRVRGRPEWGPESSGIKTGGPLAQI